MNSLNFNSVKDGLTLLKEKLSKEFKVKKIGIFGSFANGTFSENSDIDILVEFEETPGWEFFRMNSFLETHFKRKVDLVTIDAIKPMLKEKILNQVIFL